MVIPEGIPGTYMLGRFPDVLRVSPPLKGHKYNGLVPRQLLAYIPDQTP